MRTGKECKGPVGARCEHCKRLKQKCSNSTGPARGKPTGTSHCLQQVYVPERLPIANVKKPDGTPSKTSAPRAGPSTSGPSPMVKSTKRKSPGPQTTPLNGDIDGHSLDGEGSIDDEEQHEPPPRMNKKRRLSKSSGGPSRAQLVKVVTDMEASVKRIQTSVAKEVEKMNGIIKTLNTKINEMDED